jgi:hypothetical protein
MPPLAALVGLTRIGRTVPDRWRRGQRRRWHRCVAVSIFLIGVCQLQKWPAGTLFGHDALERAARLYTASGDAARVVQYRALEKIVAAGQRTGNQK